MASNASASSNYEHMVIDKDGRRIDFTDLDNKLTIVNFSYYESLLLPQVTANVTYLDLANSVSANSTYDKAQRRGTLLNSLPIRGNEKFEFIIKGKLGSLNFRNDPLRVIAASSPKQESFREATVLSLVSEYGLKNETKTVYKKYYNNISQNVLDILSKELGVSPSKLNIEQTKNSYAFLGSGKNPFSLITSLCSKSVPVDGSAGYLFWENQVGYNFRSVDSLVAAPPVNVSTPYAYYSESTSSFDNDDNDYRIYSYSFQKNQNILNSLKSGIYKTKNVCFNPYTFEYSELYLGLSKSGIKSLGNKPEYPGEFDVDDAFTRTHHFILDSGNMEVGLSTSINNNPREYQARAVIRYNLLFSQILTMTIPCNPNLKAGDVILCLFQKMTSEQDRISEGGFEENQSGNYLIVHLCHNFDTKRSFTSLTLVRDTYGLYKSS